MAAPPSPSAASVYGELARLLDGPDRRFHNSSHIADCLARFDEVVGLLHDRDAVEMAIWFHDAIYVPGDPSNERRSAELFLRLSEGARPLFRRRVCALIMTTKRAVAARGNDRKFIDDIDLAGFGAAWDEFMRHGDLLREEFSAQSDPEYYSGLAAFLAALRARPHFFGTDYYRTRYEAKARDNLDGLRVWLDERGYGGR
ncbi:MAG: hypothetical protein U1F58_14700 [Burkholderiales bacterium]